MAEHVLDSDPPAQKERKGPSAALWVFLILLIAGSVVLDFLIIKAGGIREAGALVAGIMCVPALAAIVALLVTRRSLAGVGWAPGPVRFLALAVILPVLIVTPVYAAVWAGGVGEVRIEEWTALVEENFGWRLGAVQSMLVIASIGLLVNSLVAAGEEVGWRGFLLPELSRSFSLPMAALATGVIWAVWHYPGIIWAGYSNLHAPVWYSIVSFTLMALGWSMLLAWLRFASGSVWPAALMHGAHNILIQAVLDPATQDTSGVTLFVTGEFGLGVAFAYVIAGLIAWRALAAMQRKRAGA